jgi:uncharacterized membrane protein (UPF0127 family)
VQQFRRLAAMSAVAVVLAGCSVQESTRRGGLIAPTGTAAAATSPAATVVTVAAQSTDQHVGATGVMEASLADALGDADDLPVSTAGVQADGTNGATHAGADASGETSGAQASSPVAPPPPMAESRPAEVLAAADPPEGFGEGVLGVTGPAGTRVWPVIVADTPQSRQRGLMGVTDFVALGGYAAMVFIFDGDTSGAFWMRDTPLPLRITFVAAGGSVVSGTDMAPCLPPTPAGECERYHPDGPYRIAIEHPLGPAFDIGLATAEFVEVTVE